ncbi:MAG: elongation factor 1-beta [archaeon]|nr:elongation factor 1-beta [archaeon]
MVRLRVLPTDAEITPARISESIQKSLPSNIEIRRVVEEPIAFGLVASIIDFIIEDREGEMDRLEKSVRASELVSEIEVIGLSKLSTSLK